MRASVIGAAEVFQRLRGTINVGAVQAGARRPFRFLLCGDPALMSDLRALLLDGQGTEDFVAIDAAATLETIDPSAGRRIDTSDARCVIFLGRAGDRSGARLDLLTGLGLPILVLIVDRTVESPSGPLLPPSPGQHEDYVVPALTMDALQGRFLPHLIECCKGIEIAVGRRLPALRETVAAKLTRDAALNALKVAGASAVVDHIPLLGVVIGAFASAGDMMALTGIQMMLMLQIGATYGKDPDLARVWELLPIVGGGLGWRALSRELSGFIPVAGVFIKAAIAYAGTVVVGEGARVYFQYGRHMSASDGAKLYEDAKSSAMTFARDTFAKLRRTGSSSSDSSSNRSSNGNSSNGASSNGSSLKDSLSKDSLSRDSSSKDSSSKDSLSKDSSSKDSLSKDSSLRDSLSKDSSLKDSLSKDSSLKDSLSKDSSLKDSLSKDSSLKDSLSKDSSSKDSLSKDSSLKDSSSKDSSSKVSSSKDS